MILTATLFLCSPTIIIIYFTPTASGCAPLRLRTRIILHAIAIGDMRSLKESSQTIWPFSTSHSYRRHDSWGAMAPPRGLSTPRALDVKTENKMKKLFGHEISVVLTVLHHILHARSCHYFLWFPHTPKPPGALKRSKNSNLPLGGSTFIFGTYCLEPIRAMVTRPVQGPWSTRQHNNESWRPRWHAGRGATAADYSIQ